MRRRVREGRFRALVRPTLARVREALFNTLGPRVSGARVLDLFAGSGSLGFEALRRGAASAVFVEHDAKMVEEIRLRVARGDPGAKTEVWRRDVLAAVHDLGVAGRQFDLILMDPPYGQEWIGRTLRAIFSKGILAIGGVVVAEGHWRDRPAPVQGIRLLREARYGETALWYLEQDGGAEGTPDTVGSKQ